MTILENVPLSGLTAFRLGGKARFFCSAESREDLEKAAAFAAGKKLPVFILGGGSNILVSDKGFDGLVIKMDVKGIREERTSKKQNEDLENCDDDAPRRQGTFAERDCSGVERGKGFSAGGKALTAPDQDPILIRAGAGEEWDSLVAWTVEKGYGGLENLSLIPGSVGAAPVQNIGAYGAEAKNLVEEVEAFDLLGGSLRTFSNKECRFSYRDSMFKHEKGRYAITSVLFKLKKNAAANVSYKDLQEYFKGKADPSISEVREAVIAIRIAKLPDIRKVGTAGSFFKNPVISKEHFEKLKRECPELPSFPEPDGRVKVPLAWIIDKVCGLKGKRFGTAGIHDAQALVIVNYGGATLDDIERVAEEIERSVKEKTEIEIEREVVMV